MKEKLGAMSCNCIF